jgi:HlyD family secretion protein
MAGPAGGGLFRKKSLERLSSPERLDQLLVVVDRKNWIPLVTIGILVASLVAWAVFGRIPVNVEGRGILIRPRKIVEFQSPGPGRVVAIQVEVGDEVRKGQVLALLERPDLDEQLRLHKEKAAQLTAQSRPSADSAGDLEDGALVRSGPSLKDHIERSGGHARSLRDERLSALAEEERRLDAQESIARELSQSLRERLARERGLLDDGLLAKSEVDDLQQELMESLERLYDIETQRGALKTAGLEAEEQFFDRMQTIAEWTFDLQQEIADVDREIARLTAQLAEESRLLSDHDGRILELNATTGAFVGPGDRLGAMEIADPTSSLKSVTYFQVRDGKRLSPDMPIHVTPDTVERERYGSIKGVVRSVSVYPVSLEDATSVVGNRVVARTFVDGGYLIAVTAELERSENDPELYAWTSSRGPTEVDVSAGTTTTARVAVKRERPIAFVIPLLKSTAGLD